MAKSAKDIYKVRVIAIFITSGIRYVPTYATEFTNNEAANSKYVLTLIVNEVLSLFFNEWPV